jgi:uncharacterized protein (TIGR03032 family)
MDLSGKSLATPAHVPPAALLGSEGLWHWLDEARISLAFTTYQTHRLFLLGRHPEGRLAVNVRLFDRPTGLCADRARLVMATRHSIWQLENRLGPGEVWQGCDRLYVPAVAHITGDLDVHDVALDKNQSLLFINTAFSCLATVRPGYSFEPVPRLSPTLSVCRMRGQ